MWRAAAVTVAMVTSFATAPAMAASDPSSAAVTATAATTASISTIAAQPMRIVTPATAMPGLQPQTVMRALPAPAASVPLPAHLVTTTPLPIAAPVAARFAAPVATVQPTPGFTTPILGRPAASGFVTPKATLPAAMKRMPLHDLVVSFVDFGRQDAEANCLATAVYYEARGETLEGQLAVAQVILNRTTSGRYPPSICGVVLQPAQFSFVRGSALPPVDHSDECWHTAAAIAEVALKRQAESVPANVLWYHANYVDPRWNKTMTRATQIGSHIFYS